MSASIRRMALDLSWWVWAYLLFMIGVGILIDAAWLTSPLFFNLPLMLGFILSLGGMFSAQKVALWRTLPVSQRQIDLARWLQGVFFPVLCLSLMMFATALILAGTERLHAAWPIIVLMAAAQAGGGILVFAWSVALAGVHNRIGRLAAFVWWLIMSLVFFAPRLLRGASLQTGLEDITAFGFLAAILLYVMAGRWPLPLTSWSMFWSAPQTQAMRAEPSGQGGWTALILAQMRAVLLCWCLIPGAPLLMRWVMGIKDADISVMAQMGFAVGAVLTSSFLAAAMRALRALPLTALALSLRLVGMLVAIQSLGAVIYVATLFWFQPELANRYDYILLPVAPPVLIFALTLRWGHVVALFGAPIAIMGATLGAMILRYMEFTVAQTALLVAVLTGLGFLSVWREIASGRHAYRAQPLMPLSWRGR